MAINRLSETITNILSQEDDFISNFDECDRVRELVRERHELIESLLLEQDSMSSSDLEEIRAIRFRDNELIKKLETYRTQLTEKLIRLNKTKKARENYHA